MFDVDAHVGWDVAELDVDYHFDKWAEAVFEVESHDDNRPEVAFDVDVHDGRDVAVFDVDYQCDR